ncbi:MAG: hypothetical protein KatS3mg124_0928 [Porticoccaceae bacterium]|nr:MAG: hypothetical protein KatS3mg124_0928 [Porticoccaceae bacterium]
MRLAWRLVDPPPRSALDPLDERERAGLQWALALTLGFALVVALGLVPQNGVLRDAASGSVLDGPFMRGIVVVVALWAALCGAFYGWGSGRYRHAEQIIEGMESGLSAMGSYLVLMFFAAQFVNFFSWSGLGAILAIRGASFLQMLSLPPLLLLIAFTIFSGVCNLFIGSASAKWALLAPIFVPMFHLLGLAPEASQVAYRIGDSTTNIVTPLMPYFPLVVAFLRRHDERAGVGTLLAIMVPYSLTLLLGWSAFLSLWLWSGLPLGPGSAAFLR